MAIFSLFSISYGFLTVTIAQLLHRYLNCVFKKPKQPNYCQFSARIKHFNFQPKILVLVIFVFLNWVTRVDMNSDYWLCKDYAIAHVGPAA